MTNLFVHGSVGDNRYIFLILDVFFVLQGGAVEGVFLVGFFTFLLLLEFLLFDVVVCAVYCIHPGVVTRVQNPDIRYSTKSTKSSIC
jgi:hypothetical protein